jgi:hypothetical protein
MSPVDLLRRGGEDRKPAAKAMSFEVVERVNTRPATAWLEFGGWLDDVHAA